jgi:REP element-mobilizing transposase RayT
MRGQMSLFKVPRQHGGSLAKGKRKEARPLSVSHPLHVIFRAASQMSGQYSFTRNENRMLIEKEVSKWAERFKIKIYEKSINSTHIHLLIRGGSRDGIRNFFRVMAGQIALRLMRLYGVLPRGLWESLCFSRILEWGRDFLGTMRYVLQNSLEAAGLIPYMKRGKRCQHPSLETLFKQRRALFRKLPESAGLCPPKISENLT